MTDFFPASRHKSLPGLGWSGFFAAQLGAEDTGLPPMRIATVHRARLTAISVAGPVRLVLQPHTNTGDFAVGDWVLADPQTHLLGRRLTRKTVLERHTVGGNGPQLAAANVDTLFIVTSCNDDFSVARLERYLALANQAGVEPVILLTKADMAANAQSYHDQAAALQRGLSVVMINPRSPDAMLAVAPWCGAGQTVALVGSSGVGKSTLVNTLAGPEQELPQLTGEIREHDGKGRHTTTARSLHAIAGGGWVIDTPGMRTLHVSDSADGIDTLFAEITELSHLCKFRDCTHAHEPGCAVQAAIAAEKIDPGRFARWQKLRDESQSNPQNFNSQAGKGTTAGRKKRR